MALTGFAKTCSKCCGGIKHIYLAATTDIISVTCDNNTVTGIQMNDSAFFVNYDFQEDNASYTENASLSDGSYYVEHTLSFSLNNMNTGSLSATEELAEASYDGLIAIVTTNNNESFIIGYTPQFGLERALRLKSVSSDTGKKLKDTTSRNITLYCCDTSGALSFTGTPPIN